MVAALIQTEPGYKIGFAPKTINGFKTGIYISGVEVLFACQRLGVKLKAFFAGLRDGAEQRTYLFYVSSIHLYRSSELSEMTVDKSCTENHFSTTDRRRAFCRTNNHNLLLDTQMKNESLIASNKTPFSVLTLETLSLSQILYTRTSMTDPTWKVIDTWHGGGFSGPSTTEIHSNLYDLNVPYISKSTIFEMTNATTKGVFNIEKNGNQITYTSMNSQGSVHAQWYWGIPAHVTLTIGNLEHLPYENPTKFHEEHGIQYLIAGGEVNSTTSTEGKKSIVVPDNTYFSFITNTSMYFSIVDNQRAAIYQLINDKLVQIEDRILQGYASSGGSYGLTSNKNVLYPDGISTLRVNDGFSESMAEIEFNHNIYDRTVKISVKSHTARICELRDSTIIFAL